jgi:hypothetical protein
MIALWQPQGIESQKLMMQIHLVLDQTARLLYFGTDILRKRVV